MFWDKVKKVWREVKAAELGTADSIGTIHGPDKVELGDDQEIRHEPVYDSSTGVESMQPVLRKKSEISGQ